MAEIKIYKVSTDDRVGGANHLGYVTDSEEDIEIPVKEITPELANTTNNLNKEKKTLEMRIKEINEILNS